MKYKADLHAHTCDVSVCARITVEELVDSYIEKGYSTLVIANHYAIETFQHLDHLSWREKNEHYLSAYRKAKEYANGRINILLGMEYKNHYRNQNDYLVYGITEDFILENSISDEHNFLKMDIYEMVQLAHDNGCLVFQAHPFRNNATVTPPQILDGIEIVNANPRLDSRNDIAAMWAKKFNLLASAGSDTHNPGQGCKVSFRTPEPIETNEDLLKYLKDKESFEIVEEE